MRVTGLMTGLLGYSLRKELFSEALMYREVQVFDYEIYSLDMVNQNRTTIQNQIYNEFFNKYSGDINVRVFDIPGSFTFPENSVQASKYHVQIEVKTTPSGLSSIQPELASNYYKGLDSNFFSSYATGLLDFKEGFSFAQAENGNLQFTHDIAFTMLSGMGGRNTAVQIASGVFASDKDTTFGIAAMVSGVSVANTGTFLNYFNETYDTIRNSYSFSKRRELLPATGATYTYDLTHSLEMDEKGISNITEKGIVKGALTFAQAQAGADSLINAAYNRCNAFYTTYAGLAGATVSTYPLDSRATHIVRALNKPSITVEYDVQYTNNPQFDNLGNTTDETITMEVDEKGYVVIRDSYNVTVYKRNPANNIESIINSITTDGPASIYNYYYSSSFYNANWPINNIRSTLDWPYKQNKFSIVMEYSNNPRFFRAVNGVNFNFVDYKVQNTLPPDIINEYKIINRPTKKSVLNYAYQSDKGMITVSLEAGVGRKPYEFQSGFRTDLGPYVQALFKHGTSVFLNQFSGLTPISFTYFLSDIKYNLSFEGTLTMELVFTYTLKKYTL